MNLTPDDPRLTAYLLGELSSEEARLVEHSAAADPALRIALNELEQVQKLLVNTLDRESNRLLPRQREVIFNAARHADVVATRSAHLVPMLRRRPTLLAWKAVSAAAAAAVVVIGTYFVLLPNHPSIAGKLPTAPRPLPVISEQLPLEVALLPAPAPAGSSSEDTLRPVAGSQDLRRYTSARQEALRSDGDLFLRNVADSLANSPVPQARQLPGMRPRSAVDPALQPSLRLPIHSGRASLGWVVDSIRSRQQLPAGSAVRLEEMLHSFELRPVGVTAVHSGISVAVEPLACPWKPSSTLVLLSLRCGAETAREVLASYHADPTNVRRYRLLGFSHLEGLPANDSDLPTRMGAKSSICLALEIEPSSPGGTLGTVSWNVNGIEAPVVVIPRAGDTEPTDDARFAALVCTFAQWLSKDPNALIDREILAAINRENMSDSLPADRSDFIHLVSQAIELETTGKALPSGSKE